MCIYIYIYFSSQQTAYNLDSRTFLIDSFISRVSELIFDNLDLLLITDPGDKYNFQQSLIGKLTVVTGKHDKQYPLIFFIIGFVYCERILCI